MRVYFEGWVWAKVGSFLEGVTVQNVKMYKTVVLRIFLFLFIYFFFFVVECLDLSTAQNL
jgi:hypothetical protein